MTKGNVTSNFIPSFTTVLSTQHLHLTAYNNFRKVQILCLKIMLCHTVQLLHHIYTKLHLKFHIAFQALRTDPEGLKRRYSQNILRQKEAPHFFWVLHEPKVLNDLQSLTDRGSPEGFQSLQTNQHKVIFIRVFYHSLVSCFNFFITCI